MLFAWLVAQGFTALDDSDPCVFTRVHSDGEIRAGSAAPGLTQVPSTRSWGLLNYRK